MHERENSTANKMLGGAAMATMGMSGMEMASAMSEKKAMADAELDMTAYLATFVCDYGAGRNIKGGEVDIELPSSPELAATQHFVCSGIFAFVGRVGIVAQFL